MARPLRIEYAGAHYHVMNRGNGRQVVFTAARDYELFLERLGQFSRQFEVGLLCYCCLPNHFHLYLRTEQANLSRFMQSLLTRRGSDRRARQLLIYAVCRYRRAAESLTAMAKRFGISPSGLTMARERVEQTLRRDKKLRETWLQIEQTLQTLR
jgi:REP element-mobilizing transposase RayT